MNSNLRVSVVMPSYNHGRFIREAIDSVLSQDYAPIDLLVMDGGSTDDTVAILRSYGERLSFVSAKDKGQSDAINRGLGRVNGDIVCWLNSDDTFTPGAIRHVVQAFERHPDVDFVYGRGWNVDEAGRILTDSGVLPFNLWRLIHHRNFIHQPSCFFRRSLLAKAGLVREDLHYIMDWELWIRFGAYKGLYLDEFLSCNRTYAQNKTQSGCFRRWGEIRAVVGRYTNERLPPVVWIYFLESLLQVLQSASLPKRLLRPLGRLFQWGIRKEMSGVYRDGSVAPTFFFSVGNPEGKSHVKVRLSPVSVYVPGRLGGPALTVTWQSSGGDTGSFQVEENGQAQEFWLPLRPRGDALFTHFRCHSRSAGYRLEGSRAVPPRRIVGFLQEINVAA
jgi:glycosyltransferase involved in cell wall biosynthesis